MWNGSWYLENLFVELCLNGKHFISFIRGIDPRHQSQKIDSFDKQADLFPYFVIEDFEIVKNEWLKSFNKFLALMKIEKHLKRLPSA